MKEKLKELAGQTFTYGLFTIVGRFLTFILFPLYVNYLTKYQYSDIVLIYSYLGILNILYATIFESSFFRYFDKTDVAKSRLIFSHAFFSVLLIGTIISTSIFIFSDSLTFILSGEIKNSSDLIRLAAFVPLIDAIQFIPFGLLRMTNKAKSFVVIRFIHVIIYVTLNYLLIAVFHQGVFAVLVVQLIASVTTLLIHSKSILNNITFSYDSKLMKAMLKYGVPTLPAALSTIFLNVADKPVVKEYAGSDALAVYSANYRLGIPMLLFITAFDYAWRPFFLNTYQDEGANNLFSKILTYFTLIGALIFLSFSFFIQYFVQIPFFGKGKILPDDYSGGLVIVPIILLAYWFNGMYNNFSASLHIAKKTKYLAYSIVTGTIVYFVVMLLAVPNIGYIGAAWATLIGFMTNAILIYYFAHRTYPIQYEWSKISILLVLTSVLYFVNQYLSLSFATLSDVLLKIGLILIFFVLLKIFGFFSRQEINALKRLIKRK